MAPPSIPKRQLAAAETPIVSKDEPNRVLVVEDSKAIASLLEVSINALDGVSATAVGSLAEAKVFLAEHGDEVFLSVLDLNLPDAPNGEVVDLVQDCAIPVIVLTGAIDEDLRKRMFERQVADYVVKRQLSGVEYVVKLVERIAGNRRSRILVVDDSKSFRTYVESLLRNHGYATASAENGREGLALLKEKNDIRLVVSDYNMPEMDGLQMVQEIRKIRSRDDLAIIGLSDTRNKDTSALFLKSGASDFLSKPFELEEFYCRVDQNLDMIRYVQEARDAANRDFLTKLYNRRYFFNAGEPMHERARKKELRLAIAMIDADHFKRINDEHGHQVGDEALVAIAGVLQTEVGSSGIVARFGGEEFVCLRVLGEAEEAAPFAEGLRAAIAAIELSNGDIPVPLTVSIGLTCNLQADLDHTLMKADEGVYQAKDAGRNRVAIV